MTTDIIIHLQTVLHTRSAYLSPNTDEAQEAIRAAIAEISTLRSKLAEMEEDADAWRKFRATYKRRGK